MASLHTLALHSTLFGKMEDEEKKYCDDDNTTLSSSMATFASMGDAANSPSRPRSSHKYLQQRLSKHGGNLKRRFSTSNLAEMGSKAESVSSSMMNYSETTESSTKMATTSVESEEDKRPRRKFTSQKRERMQKVNQYRSYSVTKMRTEEPESTIVAPPESSLSLGMKPVRNVERRQKMNKIRSKTMTKKISSETDATGVESSRVAVQAEESPKPRSVSTPRERVQRLNQLRSRSVTKATRTEKIVSEPESVTEPPAPAVVVGNHGTHLPKALQDKIARMRQSDSYRRRLGSVSSAENESVKTEDLGTSSSKEVEVETSSSKESQASNQNDDAMASQLASIEDKLMNPTNSSLNSKAGKPQSMLARRNRIKQKHTFIVHSQSPPPKPSRTNTNSIGESQSNAADSEVNNLLGSMSPVRDKSAAETMTQKQSESLSPIPRLSRFQRKTSHRLNARTPSPTLYGRHGQKTETKNENSTDDDDRSAKSGSLSPGPRLARVKQLGSFSHIKKRDPSPQPPNRRSNSLSPVRNPNVFDPIGSRSPPLPRPKVSSSLSPIPRPRSLRPMKTEGDSKRDPPARLDLPDISTSPKVDNDAVVPRDPDAITPRGNSPRNGFCFAFEEVDRRPADETTSRSETSEMPSGQETVARESPTDTKPEEEAEHLDLEPNECVSPKDALEGETAVESSTTFPPTLCSSDGLSEPADKKGTTEPGSADGGPLEYTDQSPMPTVGSVFVGVSSSDDAVINSQDIFTSEENKRVQGVVAESMCEPFHDQVSGSVEQADVKHDSSSESEHSSREQSEPSSPAATHLVGEEDECAASPPTSTDLAPSQPDTDSGTSHQESLSPQDPSPSNEHGDVPRTDSAEDAVNDQNFEGDDEVDEASVVSETPSASHHEATQLAEQVNQIDADTNAPPPLLSPVSNEAGESGSTETDCDLAEQNSDCSVDDSVPVALQKSVSHEADVTDNEDQESAPSSNDEDSEALNQNNDGETAEMHESITHCSTEEVKNTATARSLRPNLLVSASVDSDPGSVHYESFADRAGVGLSGSFSPGTSPSKIRRQIDRFMEPAGGEQENAVFTPSETQIYPEEAQAATTIESFYLSNADDDAEPQENGTLPYSDNYRTESEASQPEFLKETPSNEDPNEAQKPWMNEGAPDTQMLSSEHAPIHATSFPSASSAMVHSSTEQSEGVDLSSIEIQDQTAHRISSTELAELRHAAAASSIFDDTSSVANTESTFNTTTIPGGFGRLGESRDFRDVVQTSLSLGPLEEGPEQSPRESTPRNCTDTDVSQMDQSHESETSSVVESAPLSPPRDIRGSPKLGTTNQTLFDNPDIQAQLLSMPPPPPPEGKKTTRKKRRRRSAKRQTKHPQKSAATANDETNLEFSSDDSEDEDLANFIESLGESPEKQSLGEPDDFHNAKHIEEGRSTRSFQENLTPHIPLVENVSSNASCASEEQTETLDVETDGLTVMVPVEDYSYPSTDHGVKSQSSRSESIFMLVESKGAGVARERVISPVSAAKILHDSKLAEKVDNAISIAAEKLEHQAPDRGHLSVNEPGSIVDLPEPNVLHIDPVKLTRSRASATPWGDATEPERNDTVSKRYIVPEGRPSPFEAIVYLKPEVIGQILDFLGDPVEVCRMKGLNRTCFYYIEDNQHKLMQRAVRLGGMSMGQRPAFWMWVILAVSQRHADHNPNSPVSQSDASLAENWGGEDLVRLQKMGRSGKWNLIIERDVSRSFGNLPPHKTGARLRTDSIVRALVSWGRNRTLKSGVRGAGPAPIPSSRNASFDSEDDLSQAPTDTVSDWGGVSPSGSFGTMSLSSNRSEQQSKNRSGRKDSRKRRSDDELALSGNVLTDETKEILQKKLSFILHALSAAHSEIGYCQGMDYVVAHLLRLLQETVKLHAAKGTLPSCIRSAPEPALLSTMSQDEISDHLMRIDRSLVLEETCFRMMDILLTKYNLGHFYWPELRCLKTCCRVFEKLIQIKLPVLADHFEHHELNVGLFALGWFQTLFLYLPSMPTATVCHMWDIWLVERSFKIFFRVATAILFLSQPILLNHELEGMMSYLNTFPDATLLSPDILIACAMQIKVTNRMLMELEQEVVDESYT